MNGEHTNKPAHGTEDQKMDPAFKARWLKALRSGAYLQARESLRANDCFCCLGVLCDVTRPDGWDEDGWSRDAKGTKMESSLPWAFMAEIKLDFPIEAKLIAMNDEEGKSFAEIADWIEANL